MKALAGLVKKQHGNAKKGHVREGFNSSTAWQAMHAYQQLQAFKLQL